MKHKMKKSLACLLALAMVFGMVGMQTPVYADAAEEISFSCTKKSVAIDGTYLLEVEGITDKKATYSWSSSAPSVAVVSSKGLVTGIAEGSATIKCKVTLSDKSTKTLSCKVTVKEQKAAYAVKISNAKRGTINAHTLQVGESYDFNRTLSPSGSNDKTYWYIQDEEYATVDSNGVVTAKKEGITMLVAKSGIDRIDAELLTNTVTDYVYLNIVSTGQSKPEQGTAPTVAPTAAPTVAPTAAPTPSVTVTPSAAPTTTVTPSVTVTPSPALGEAAVADVKLLSFDELAIVFGQPVVKSAVVKTNGVITDYITIIARSNALDYGTLTGELSQDGMTLVIHASDGFDGVYQISVASGIKTTGGDMIASYSEQKRLSDTINPQYVETKVDAKGYINTIYFSEAIDVRNMEIVGVENCSRETEAILSDIVNYTLAEDGKSMTVDLSNMRSEDENKDLIAVINGICDKAGNFTNPYSLRVVLRADTKFRSVANLIAVERVSLTEVVATFDGALIDAGELTVGNYTVIGRVNPKNEYQAIYELNESQSKLTGRQVVTVNKWYSYYATGAATTPKKSVIDFTPSVTSPTIQDAVISQTTVADVITTIITLTYNKNVTLLYPYGTLNITLDDNGGYIIPMNVNYFAEADDNVVTITISDSQMGAAGTYTVTIPEYFCADTYDNYSAEKILSLEVDLENSSKLAAPYEISQDPENASVVYVKFANMVDKVSAQNIKNYIVNGATPLSAVLVEQTQGGATIKLTLSPKTIQYTGTYPVQIRNIKGYGDTLNQMDDYKAMVSFIENTPPMVDTVKMVSANEVVITFRESSKLQGSPDFTVYLPGSNNDIALYSYLLDDNTVHIELSSVTSGYVIVKPTSLCSLYDVNGNKASLEVSYNALRSY